MREMVPVTSFKQIQENAMYNRKFMVLCVIAALMSILLFGCGASEEETQNADIENTTEITEASSAPEEEPEEESEEVKGMTLEEAKDDVARNNANSIYIMDNDSFYPFITSWDDYNMGIENLKARTFTNYDENDNYKDNLGNAYIETEYPGISKISGQASEDFGKSIPKLSGTGKLVEVKEIDPNICAVEMKGEHKYTTSDTFYCSVRPYDTDEVYMTYYSPNVGGIDVVTSINGKSLEELIDFKVVRDTYENRITSTDQESYDNYENAHPEKVSKDENLRLISVDSSRFELVYLADSPVEIKGKKDINAVDTVTVTEEANKYLCCNIPKDIKHIEDKVYPLEYIETDNGYYEIDTSSLPAGLYSIKAKNNTPIIVEIE